MNPISTYRLQFHKEFTFDDLEKVVPYLQKLGIKTIYASPVFESAPGSTHGYDGMNPHKINPELGTESQLKALSNKLQGMGMNWLQDIVPNHMAFDPGNPWVKDVLEKGQQSVFASHFDIDWNSPADHGKLMVPFLGAHIETVLTHELKIEYSGNRFVFNYYDTLYPLSPRSYAIILNSQKTELLDIKLLSQQLEMVHRVTEPEILSRQWDEFLLQLFSLMRNPDVRDYVDTSLRIINSDKDKLKQIVDEQHYHLEYWEETDRQINFRRFFTVSGLICLNMQDDKVFDHFHTYIKSLVDQQVFSGLRVDHVDGLYNPEGYLARLRKLVGEQLYIVVEKILEPGESLPKEWPVEGSTGYDFLAMVNNLFTDKEAEKDFTRFYIKLSWDKGSIQQQIHDKKAYILYQHMGGELDNLYQLLLDLDLIDRADIENDGSLKSAIAEFLIQCPVYRYYGNQLPLCDEESNAIQSILNQIRNSKVELHTSVSLLEQVFLIKPLKGDEDYNSRVLKFYQRCMQFTGPLMAKGVEDTLMYTYNRFVSHNEVGDSPLVFGYTPDQFHQLMLERQRNWPLSMNGTSTHDTKRGEDVRARLNVLTEIPENWMETISQWRFLNENLAKKHNLDANTEYFIYQTLIGALPMPDQDDSDFKNRIHEYLVKALREGKQHSDWSTPDEESEGFVQEFASALLDREKPFYRILRRFTNKIVDFGIINSLSQVLLKFACPGVPDIYQGCELWDLNLVDPDNRRSVDYQKRSVFLDGLDQNESDEVVVKKLWESRYDGQIKLWLTHLLLKLRGDNPDFFAKADYVPLKVKGRYKEHIMAFARRYKHQWIVVVVPLHVAKLCKRQKSNLEDLKWKNTRVLLPPNAPSEFKHLISNDTQKADDEILISAIFTEFPIAILTMQHLVSDRSAGILLHITSLPSPFGVGDLGPGARRFADYLSNSRQKYWQLLPLSPTEAGQGYSPYSALSTMAGNTLLISPELLAEEGLLERSSLKQYYQKEKSQVDYETAKQIKEKLFNEAYHAFCNNGFLKLNSEFEQFCKSEEEWLDDFAIYLLLKHQHDGNPWYEWPEEFKLRNPEALLEFSNNNADDLGKIKWLQFIFLRQWKDLQEYCRKLDINLLGDLPFYVSNDSADVWANKEIFCIDEEGKMTGIAGVPPDYFNENGQLWGMPVFKWDVLKAQDYAWWLKRLTKNLQLYDLLRLDHFRAFSTYWEVPAGEISAINGEWKFGPGADFFKVLKKEFGELPFVAEDLGEVNQAVYDLRDQFGLPGMSVLQFSFGDDLPKSVHSLHNFIANSVIYTGTHDNNTTRGWFRQDVDEQVKENIEKYTGIAADENNVHLILARLAYSSVGKLVILPMQDIIGLNEEGRMNTPASTEKNWGWRLQSKQLKRKYARRLRQWVEMFNRG